METVKLENIKVGNRSYNVISDPTYANHLRNDFEPYTCDLINCFSNSGVCLDIGANIGMTTLLMSDLFDYVYSFEPAPSTFALLKENIERNCLANVTPYNVGLGSKAFSTEIQFAEGNRSGGFINDITKASEGHITENITVEKGDSLLKRHYIRPAFIKIDVEGYELNALRGLKKIMRTSRPVVMLEANHWCLNAFQRTSLPDFLEELLRIFPILYAVHDYTYLDLHSESDRYSFYYSNILQNSFIDVVGGFSASQFDRLVSTHSR